MGGGGHTGVRNTVNSSLYRPEPFSCTCRCLFNPYNRIVVNCMSNKSLDMSSKSLDIVINVHNEVLSDAKA